MEIPKTFHQYGIVVTTKIILSILRDNVVFLNDQEVPSGQILIHVKIKYHITIATDVALVSLFLSFDHSLNKIVKF